MSYERQRRCGFTNISARLGNARKGRDKVSYFNSFRLKMLALHSCIFFIFSSFYVTFFSGKTDLNDFDARFTALMASDQIRNTESILNLRSDFLFGLGNLQQGYLWRFDPVSFLGVAFGDIYNPYVVAVIISVLLFFCSYAFSRKFGAPENVSIFAAYLVPISTVWSHAHGLVDNQNYALVPQTASLLLFSMLLLMCIESVGPGSIRQNFLWSIASLLIILYMVAVLTQTLVLTFGLIFSVCLGSYIKLLVDRQYVVAAKRVLSLGLILCFLWLVGVVDYLSGFYRNTAATQNARESFSPAPLRELGSFIFDSFFPLSNGRVTQVVSLLIAAFFVHGIFVIKTRNVLYFSTVVFFLSLFAYRLWQREWLFELGPRHVYLVWFAVPLYAAAVAQMIFVGLVSLGKFMNHSKLLRVKNVLNANYIYIPLIIFVTVASTSQDVRLIGAQSRPLTVVLDETEIFLSQQIALLPKSQFKGRVVDVKEHTDYEAIFQGRIPTINEHSHLVTPLSVAFYQHFLFDPEITPTRSNYKFATRNPTIYSLLGVKYLRTDSLTSTLSEFNNANSYPAQKFGSNDYLITFKNTNIGDYSPTSFFTVGTLAETFEVMDRDDFSLLNDAVVYKPMSNELVKASSSKISLEGGDLRIVANSPGKSVLLLPLEFSNCFVFNSNDKNSEFLDAFRVNGILTGLLFDKKLDVTAQIRYGIFSNSGCRLKDLEDYKVLTER